MFYVYLLLDPRKDNRPFYVGKGSGDRWKDHLTETEKSTINKRKFYTIQKINNLGLGVTVDIVNYFDDESEAYDFEAVLIKQYGRKGYDVDGILTNICADSRPPNWHSGPEAIAIIDKIRKTKSEQDTSHSQETKDKISSKLKGKKKKPFTEEHKLAMSKAKKGKLLIKTCSDTTRQKRSQNQTGKKATDKACQAISNGLTGRKLSAVHRENIKIAMQKRREQIQ